MSERKRADAIKSEGLRIEKHSGHAWRWTVYTDEGSFLFECNDYGEACAWAEGYIEGQG